MKTILAEPKRLGYPSPTVVQVMLLSEFSHSSHRLAGRRTAERKIYTTNWKALSLIIPPKSYLGSVGGFSWLERTYVAHSEPVISRAWNNILPSYESVFTCRLNPGRARRWRFRFLAIPTQQYNTLYYRPVCVRGNYSVSIKVICNCTVYQRIRSTLWSTLYCGR